MSAREVFVSRRWFAGRLMRLAALGATASGLAACSISGGLPSGPAALATGAAATTPVAPQAPGHSLATKVALLLPLCGTAQAAAVAKGMKQAAEMALFEFNNPAFELVVKDTEGTAEGATRAAKEATGAGAELIIGPLFATSVAAVRQVAAPAGVPVIAFSNDRKVAGNGVYLLSFMAEEEVERIISFAVSQGKRGIAALIPENAYGDLMVSAFQASVTRNGGQIIAMERYPVNSNGILAPSERLFKRIEQARAEGLSADAIFLPGGPDTLPNIAPLIKYANAAHGAAEGPGQEAYRGAGGTPKLLGSGGWDYPNLGRNGAFVGSWYPAPDPRGWQSFSEKFSRTFGSAPPRIATLAHDATMVAIRLASQYPAGERYTAGNIARANGFVGIDGPFRFNPDGTSTHSLAVLEVQAYKSVVIDAAVPPVSSNGVSTGALHSLAERSVAVRN